MSSLPTPAPPVNDETRPFWEATVEERLHLPRCGPCEQVIWYPRSFCPGCHGPAEWIDVDQSGSVYSFSVVHKGQGRWAGASPYVVAYVELDCGVRMLSDIVEVDPAQVEIGMRVEAVFHPTDEGPALVRFRPEGQR